MPMQFHYLDGRKRLPACGAPKADHPTKNVTKYKQCPKCTEIVRKRLGKTA